MPDEGDGKRYEIVGGVRFMTPSPFERHQRASGNLEYLLRRYLEDRDLGVVYDAPFDVVLSDDTVLVPDIVFVSKDRVSIIENADSSRRPISSSRFSPRERSRRDRGIKLRAYAEHGVREYWILDPVHRSIEIFVLEGRDLVKSSEHSAGKVSSPIVLPGFSATLDRIFGTPPGALISGACQGRCAEPWHDACERSRRRRPCAGARRTVREARETIMRRTLLRLRLVRQSSCSSRRSHPARFPVRRSTSRPSREPAIPPRERRARSSTASVSFPESEAASFGPRSTTAARSRSTPSSATAIP